MARHRRERHARHRPRRLLHAAGQSTSPPPTSTPLDVTDPDAVDAAVAGHDVVVNAAAWTAVDAAEEHESQALAVNGEAPRLLARAARAHGARLVQISTDYVFDGSASTPYAEDAPALAGVGLRPHQGRAASRPCARSTPTAT